jgi:hypothetical protein
MLGDRSDTAVDVITVELSIRGTRHFLGSPIMDRHETVNFERGETAVVKTYDRQMREQ